MGYGGTEMFLIGTIYGKKVYGMEARYTLSKTEKHNLEREFNFYSVEAEGAGKREKNVQMWAPIPSPPSPPPNPHTNSSPPDLLPHRCLAG